MSLFVPPNAPALDANADPLSGAGWYFFTTQTNTPATVYTTEDRDVAHDHPVVADSGGKFPPIYLDPDVIYRAQLLTSAGAIRYDVDPYITFSNILGQSSGASGIGTTSGSNVQAVLDDLSEATTGLEESVDSLEGQFTAFNTTTGAYYENEAADDVPMGATGTGAITGGSGGTNGSFALAFTGGNFIVNPTGTFTVAGGAVTAITITGAGLYIGASISAPTLDFTASSGLTGASASLTTGVLVTAGKGYWAASTDSRTLELWRNDAGSPVAVDNPDASQISIVNGSILSEEPYFGGDTGAVLVKTGVADGEFGYRGREVLSDQPVAVTDLTAEATYQFFQAFGPTQRYTATEVGTELNIAGNLAAIYPVGIGIPEAIEVGKIYVVEGRMTTAGANGSGNAGVYFGYSNLAPVAGAAKVDHQSGSALITMRGNGAIAVYDHQSNALFGATITPGGGAAAFTTETVRLVVEPLTTTSAKVTIFIDGTQAMVKEITGLPSGCYVTGGVRISGSGGVGRISALNVYTKSLDVVKRIHLHPDVGAVGGTGTEANPFQTLEELVQDAEIDSNRRTLDLVTKAGLARGQLTFDGGRWRDIRIRGSSGGRTIINASDQITGSVWTEISSSGVWYATQPLFLGSGSSPYGGLVDVTSGVSETFGRTSSYTVDGRRGHSRIAINTAYNDASFVAGSYSNHNTGTYSGKILLKPWGGVDPNTRTYECSRWSSALSVVAPDDVDGWNGCLVRISNIELMYAFLYNLYLSHVQYELEDIYSGGANVGYGFEMNHCTGRGYGLIGEGNGYDGLHASADGTASERILYNGFFDCQMKGMGGLPQGAGDGFSLHKLEQHRSGLHNCTALAAGKDGASMPGSCDMTDFTADDCADSGVKLYGDILEETGVLNIKGGKLSRNLYGLSCINDVLVGISRTVNAERVHFENNATNSVLAYGPDSDTIVNLLNCTTSGSVPSGGHIDDSDGTVNITTGVAIA